MKKSTPSDKKRKGKNSPPSPTLNSPEEAQVYPGRTGRFSELQLAEEGSFANSIHKYLRWYLLEQAENNLKNYFSQFSIDPPTPFRISG